MSEYSIGAAMWRLQWGIFWHDLGRALTVGGGRR